MKSYQIVKAAIHHTSPPRLPVNFGCFGCSDFGWLPVKQPQRWEPSVPGEDEWGCVWSQTEMKNMGQVTGNPLKSLDDVDSIKRPDYDDDSRYEDVPAALEAMQAESKYVIAGLFMVLFERMHTLFGFENTLCGLLTDQDRMGALADLIVDTHAGYVRNVHRRFGDAVHGINVSEDWGTQTAAFISFDLWMEFFFPRYRRLFDFMHECGYDVWVHSCGKVNEIIEGFIRAGVDVMNLQQPRALGIREIGRRYKGRIAFESLADIQHTLPTGDRDKIDADVEELMRYWAGPEGGFVLADYGDNEAIGVTEPGTKLHMYTRFSEASERLYGNPLPAPRTE